MKRSVVVFASSSSQLSPIFYSEVELLAIELVHAGYQIIYGGGRMGLMGALADAALAHGGHVTGVIPRYLAQPGIVHEGLSELVVVDNLLDRKKQMLYRAHAAIACPGGVGTLDEVTEVIALKQLNEHQKPIIFHNFLDCWDPILNYCVELKERRMIKQELQDLYDVAADAKAVVALPNTRA